MFSIPSWAQYFSDFYLTFFPRLQRSCTILITSFSKPPGALHDFFFVTDRECRAKKNMKGIFGFEARYIPAPGENMNPREFSNLLRATPEGNLKIHEDSYSRRVRKYIGILPKNKYHINNFFFTSY